MAQLARTRCCVAVDAVVTGIKRLDETFDRSAFAACIRPLHDDEEARPDLAVGVSLAGDLAAEFARHEHLALVVPAEGTRDAVEYWKSGFYRIAVEAQVPIVLAFVDRNTRTGGFGPSIMPSGDVGADMDGIRAFYVGMEGLKPGRFGPVRLREEEAAE